METISNNELKQIRALREKKYRDESGLFLVEGEKLVAEAEASGFGIVRIIRRDEVGEKTMERISTMSSPSPVIAVVRKPTVLEHVPGGLCIALDSVRDPGNLGTILRIADWFGVDCIFASPDSVEVYNPKVVQASMGAIFRKKLIYCDMVDKCKEFRAAGLHVFGTFLDGSYAAFGRVTEGQEVADQIAKDAKPVDNNGTIPAAAQPVIEKIIITD